MDELRRLVKKLDQLAVSVREAYFDGIGLIRHYLLPDGRVVEVVLR
jgi:hypothetical protein